VRSSSLRLVSKDEDLDAPHQRVRRRVGARRPRDVSPATLAELERDTESSNHMEQIALDMGNLLSNLLPDLRHRASELRDVGLVTRMRRGGQVLLEELGLDAVPLALTWRSDTARGWGAMAVGAAHRLSLEQRLYLIRPFALDEHFAVREWAWLSLRPHVVEEPGLAIVLLTSWAHDTSALARRFAVELTRPRGVWSAHIPMLKRDPARGEPVLDPLRSDSSVYVQNAVGNWINDGSKTAPAWAVSICERWLAVPDPRTARICRRGLRTLRRRAS
jgi:3-methyladenine DNA glycosylase AlkC